MEVAREDLDRVFTLVDVVTINDEEARQYTGERSLKKAAKKILALGPKALIIKKGEHGALLFGGDKVFFAPAMLLDEVRDPTGAGDSFAGGFIGYLAKTDDISFENMKRAIVHGSALASFTCEDFGPDALLKVNREELDLRLKAFAEMVQVG
jgi:sugar/nucleoside kinase (ribokinase family)